MPKPYLFFDFDGTVTDSSEGIFHSFAHALTRLGQPVPSQEKLKTLIGPPLFDDFADGLGLDPQTAARGVTLYREYYREHGIYECRLYDGMAELLDSLKSEATLVIATCKPEPFAIRAVKHLGVEDRFALIAGSNLDGSRDEKSEVITHAMHTLGITDPNEVLMIGDRANDVLGARRVGVSCAGALWGFGSESELLEAGACALLPTPLQSETFLKNWITFRKN